MFDSLMAWLSETFTEILTWLKDLLLWIPRKVYEEVLDGMASFFESLPVPDFIIQASSALSGISGNVLFFAQKFAVGEGIILILSAYILRFILRRIPFIG
ncbi:hypothetical protein [Pseudomonas sp. TMP9]|uniref:hypothetical protein n=1 Tax=Pseudomonas sp. TMP9 TaxID=3133144 RepID=UPI0030CD7EDD